MLICHCISDSHFFAHISSSYYYNIVSMCSLNTACMTPSLVSSYLSFCMTHSQPLPLVAFFHPLLTLCTLRHAYTTSMDDSLMCIIVYGYILPLPPFSHSERLFQHLGNLYFAVLPCRNVFMVDQSIFDHRETLWRP